MPHEFDDPKVKIDSIHIYITIQLWHLSDGTIQKMNFLGNCFKHCRNFEDQGMIYIV